MYLSHEKSVVVCAQCIKFPWKERPKCPLEINTDWGLSTAMIFSTTFWWYRLKTVEWKKKIHSRNSQRDRKLQSQSWHGMLCSVLYRWPGVLSRAASRSLRSECANAFECEGERARELCSTRIARIDRSTYANAALRMLADNLNSIGNLWMYIIECLCIFERINARGGGVDFI